MQGRNSPGAEDMAAGKVPIFHRHDLRKKYLEGYIIERDYSTATRAGTVRESTKRIGCLPRISHYPRLQAQVQQLEQNQDFGQVAILLTELDLYLSSFPGTVEMPEYVRSNGEAGTDDEVDFIEVNRTPHTVVDIEQYVLQCILVKVVKSEEPASEWPVKQEH